LVIASSSAYLALQLAGRHNAKQTTLARGQADYYASTVHMLRYNHKGLASMQLRADRLEHVPDSEQLKLIEPRLWLSSEGSHTQIQPAKGRQATMGS
jgi:LPS export ABC transporter protein LptC